MIKQIKSVCYAGIGVITFGIVSISNFAISSKEISIYESKASAQSIYYGSGVKEVRVCNNDNSFRMDIKAKVYGDVHNVEFKAKYGRTYTALWGAVQTTSGYQWRHLGTYNKTSDGNYYHLQRVIHNALTYEDLLFSLHVNTNSGKIIDLGGIKNLGPVEKGKCVTQYFN
jgi:hypothetical protein